MEIIKEKSKNCCIFNKPELEFKENKDFSVVKEYGEIPAPNNCTRNLLKCNKCGALFLSQSLEWNIDGNDNYYTDYIQVKDIIEADKLNNQLDALKFRNKNNPMIMIDSDNTVRYIFPESNTNDEQEYAKELVENAEKIIKSIEQQESEQVNDQSKKIIDTTVKVEIDKNEYDILKKLEQEYMDFEFVDFAIKLYSGSVIPINHPNYNDDRIDIEIFGLDKYSININGQKYNINSQQLFNKIKSFVTNNLDTLIKCSKAQNNLYLNSNSYEGGNSSYIKIKYGQLIIYINGQVSGNIGNFCEQFIDIVKKLIIDEGEKTNFNYFDEMIGKIKDEKKTDLEDEFTKYCKLYEEKFGKKAYIAEPGGTKEQTINAIKECLKRNEDVLDKILYPTFEKDMEDGVLY